MVVGGWLLVVGGWWLVVGCWWLVGHTRNSQIFIDLGHKVRQPVAACGSLWDGSRVPPLEPPLSIDTLGTLISIDFEPGGLEACLGLEAWRHAWADNDDENEDEDADEGFCCCFLFFFFCRAVLHYEVPHHPVNKTNGICPNMSPVTRRHIEVNTQSGLSSHPDRKW